MPRSVHHRRFSRSVAVDHVAARRLASPGPGASDLRDRQGFRRGRAPGYKGLKELQVLSSSIGGMMDSLKAKTLHLETTLESMSDGISVFDADMRLVAWNEQYARLHHYPPNLIRSGVSFADIIRYNVDRGDYGPGDPEPAAPGSSSGPEPGPAAFRDRPGRRDQPGGAPRPMPDGGFVTTFTDITDRKRMSCLRRFLAPTLRSSVISSGDDRMLQSHRRMWLSCSAICVASPSFAETAEPEEVMEVLERVPRHAR